MLIGDLMQYEPCEERGLSWLERTNTPFDPLHSMRVLLHRTVRCPGCGRSNDVRESIPTNAIQRHSDAHGVQPSSTRTA